MSSKNQNPNRFTVLGLILFDVLLVLSFQEQRHLRFQGYYLHGLLNGFHLHLHLRSLPWCDCLYLAKWSSDLLQLVQSIRILILVSINSLYLMLDLWFRVLYFATYWIECLLLHFSFISPQSAQTPFHFFYYKPKTRKTHIWSLHKHSSFTPQRTPKMALT